MAKKEERRQRDDGELIKGGQAAAEATGWKCPGKRIARAPLDAYLDMTFIRRRAQDTYTPAVIRYTSLSVYLPGSIFLRIEFLYYRALYLAFLFSVL